MTSSILTGIIMFRRQNGGGKDYIKQWDVAGREMKQVESYLKVRENWSSKFSIWQRDGSGTGKPGRADPI